VAEGDADLLGPSKPFGEWLRTERMLRTLSRAELAAISGVSQMQISNLERGRTLNPQPTTREKLARAFEVHVPAALVIEAGREVAVQELRSPTTFDPYDDDSLPEVAGVYVFYDISGRPVYVGLSQKRPIRDRVREHYEKFWFKKPIVDRASYVEIQDENLCAQIGQILLRFLKSNVVLTHRLPDQSA
jgi:transcriptional regulator with XRE-family HTH domain